MTALLLRKDLLQIFYFIAKKLTSEDVKWLKQHAPIWEDFSHIEGPETSSDWEIRNLMSVFSVSFRIQEMIDAKIKQRLTSTTTYGEGLPKIYLLKIADLLGVEIAEKNKMQLISEILERISNAERDRLHKDSE